MRQYSMLIFNASTYKSQYLLSTFIMFIVLTVSWIAFLMAGFFSFLFKNSPWFFKSRILMNSLFKLKVDELNLTNTKYLQYDFFERIFKIYHSIKMFFSVWLVFLFYLNYLKLYNKLFNNCSIIVQYLINIFNIFP